MDPWNFSHTVADLLMRSYRQFADRTALVLADGAEMTYAELGEVASRMAGGLRERGVEPGDRLVLAQRNGPEFAMADHAMFWGGFVRVAVSFRLHAAEIAKIAADSEAKAVVVDDERRTEVERALRAVGARAMVVGATAGDGLTLPLLAQGPAIEAHRWQLDDLAWMPYTSGTTGNPKGVMHTQRSVMASLRNMLAEFPTTSQDTVLLVAPMSHLAGWLRLCYSIRGARQVFMPDFDAHEALTLIAEYRVTVLPAVPTIINFLTDQLESGAYDIDSLTTVIYAGSPMAPERLARAIAAFGPVFMQCYGLTELPMPLTALHKSDHVLLSDDTVPRQLASAGRVTPFVEIRIADAEGNEVAPGEIGEIQTRSDNVMRGYWQLPDESAAFILDGGWRGTGDVGRFDDGYLYIVDRKRDLIVSGGFNVFPSEVEAAIAAVAGVREVAVVGVPDPKWGETVLAVVVADPGAALSAQDLLDACRDAIAGYKLPRRIEFVDELPKNSSGKLMRRDLRQRYWAEEERNVG